MDSFVFLLLLIFSGAFADIQWPRDFPSLTRTPFVNWADDIRVDSMYTVYPSSGEEVVKITNWARENNYTVRASGRMHTWAPLTVSARDPSIYDLTMDPTRIPNIPLLNLEGNTPPQILLLRTVDNLNRMRIINSDPFNASFWAEPGILMDDLLRILENHELGFLATPAPGDITLGGALAVGAHGTGVPAKGEKLTPGHTFGSMSNLIMGFTAVVYDKDLDKYSLKDFKRSDPESKAFMVNLGRAYITNFTMRAGPLQFVQCKSYTNIPAADLFAHPRDSEDKQTISYFLDLTGRIEIILFPFTEIPWLKVWNVTSEKPRTSRRVSRPYNYRFTDMIPQPIAMMFGLVQSRFRMVTIFGPAFFETVKSGLGFTQTYDIWGPARAVHNYIRPTTLRVTANGYAIHTTRENVQMVSHDAYRIYKDLLQNYASRGLFPINGPLEVRVTGVDDPDDVMMESAQDVGIAATSPVRSMGTPGTFDTVVWVDVLTFPKTENITDFMAELESAYYEKFDGRSALIRVEWSKGWAYNGTASSPWQNTTVMTKATKDDFSDWSFTRRVLNGFDPFAIFTNKLLQDLFETDKP
ncbi:unnamed protein product [Allacma fusca]|uniref:FAD-binding PCMH-type domain-containing protein n=1 Tax=Allacma fusca TaxID=39272 RepID=A0A8J2KX93_9HEXA|nr:unnamed protein product [Allacma fusca]